MSSPTLSSRGGDDADISLLFDQPLVFDQILEHNNDSSIVHCAVLVFNMALAAHQKFRECGDKIYQTKALQLYDSSIDFFSKASRYFDFAGVVSAALNNKASIYFDESMYDDLERDLAKLSRVLVVADQTITTGRFLQEDEFQGILLNLMLLRRPVAAEAA
jgi:hypothetical protein